MKRRTNSTDRARQNPPCHAFMSCLPDPEAQDVAASFGALQNVAGLIDQIGNIDRGERIGAFNQDHIAGGFSLEDLPCPQGRERTFETAQIQSFFIDCHGFLIISCKPLCI